MNYLVFEAHHDNKRFIIEQDRPELGYYLYVYEGEKETHDFLQNDLHRIKMEALEEFGVPYDAWVRMPDKP